MELQLWLVGAAMPERPTVQCRELRTESVRLRNGTTHAKVSVHPLYQDCGAV